MFVFWNSKCSLVTSLGVHFINVGCRFIRLENKNKNQVRWLGKAKTRGDGVVLGARIQKTLYSGRVGFSERLASANCAAVDSWVHLYSVVRDV